MFGNRKCNDVLTSLYKTYAVIEFEPNGTIIEANENFLDAMGYSLDEIKGQHYKMFVEPDYANSAEYKHFGKIWLPKNLSHPNTNASAKAAKKSGSKPHTTQS